MLLKYFVLCYCWQINFLLPNIWSCSCVLRWCWEGASLWVLIHSDWAVNPLTASNMAAIQPDVVFVNGVIFPPPTNRRSNSSSVAWVARSTCVDTFLHYAKPAGRKFSGGDDPFWSCSSGTSPNRLMSQVLDSISLLDAGWMSASRFHSGSKQLWRHTLH